MTFVTETNALVPLCEFGSRPSVSSTSSSLRSLSWLSIHERNSDPVEHLCCASTATKENIPKNSGFTLAAGIWSRMFGGNFCISTLSLWLFHSWTHLRMIIWVDLSLSSLAVAEELSFARYDKLYHSLLNACFVHIEAWKEKRSLLYYFLRMKRRLNFTWCCKGTK